MTATPQVQRRWQALCPNCGAPVSFASAASVSAVCGYCRSTLLREGETLRRIGVVAELFDDHSPLQLGAGGRHHGVAFTLVGRVQYRYDAGTWNEWHALFDGEAGKSAWLSEDNGAYVMAFEQPTLQPAPDLASLPVGAAVQIAGQAWRVASRQNASLIAAEGELPRAPQLQGAFPVVDLRADNGAVGTLEWPPGGPPVWSIGQAVTLDALAMNGLREGPAEAKAASRTLPCPSCGATLAPTLASTQTITCGQCRAVVDVSSGVGAELAHFTQTNSGVAGREPDLPLGRVGRLAVGPEGALDWQVVGFQERCSVPEDDEDEREFWREYLLYHRTAGFAFLVDAASGWSVVRPITGVPSQRGADAQWQGRSYRREEAPYAATTTWVLGEFYWRVRQGEVLQVTDYRERGGPGLLSAERSDTELVWSAGRQIPDAQIEAAFGLKGPSPSSTTGSRSRLLEDAPRQGSISQGLVVLVVVILVMAMMWRCDGSDRACEGQRQSFGDSSAEYQQCLRDQRSNGGYSHSGGSFGGFSSGGGGHK